MKTPHAQRPWAPRLAALVFSLAPLATWAADQPAVKPAPADTTASRPAHADSGDATSAVSKAELERLLKKYDANGNGVLDKDELARMKADKKSQAVEDKMDARSNKRINHSIRKSNKASRVR